MDLLLRQGKSVPEIAIMLRKGERTVWRWKSQLSEHHSQAFTLMDVREIHARRMADLYQAQCELDAIAYDMSLPAETRMTAFRTKLRVHAIHDQILRQAGYYRAFDLSRESSRAESGERSAEAFVAMLEQAVFDVVELDTETEAEERAPPRR